MSCTQLLVVVGHFKSRGLVDGSGQGAILLVKVGATVNRFSFGSVLMRFHKKLHPLISQDCYGYDSSSRVSFTGEAGKRRLRTDTVRPHTFIIPTPWRQV